MVLRVGELWDAEIVRIRLGALVDPGIEIDEVPAGRAGRLHVNLHIALAVEGADIAVIAVVVDLMHDVGGLGPAHALKMDRELGPHRPARNIERHRGRLDEVGADGLALAFFDPQTMRAAQIIRCLKAELDPA